jgi:hypothetical protein
MVYYLGFRANNLMCSVLGYGTNGLNLWLLGFEL